MVLRSRHLGTAAAVAFLAAVLFAGRRLFPFPFETAARLLVLATKCALLSAAFIGWGGLLHRALAGRAGGKAPLAAAWALGAALTATVVGFLAPVWYPDALFYVPWLGAGVALLLRGRADIDLRISSPGRLLWALAPFGLAATLLALAPPLSLDALVYHLAIPRQFALQGQAFEMPWNLHSYFPQHAEGLFGLTLELEATGVLAQLLHLSAAFWTLAVVFRVGRREFGRLAGGLAVVLLFSIPVYCLISGWAWNDWFVLLYAACGIDHVLRLRDSPQPGSYLLAAVFLGAAAAVKYNALPLLALLAVGLAKPYRRHLPAAALAVVLLLAPWYGKNLLAKGNPVFPFFSSAHGSGTLTDYRGEAGAAGRWLGYLGRRDMVDESLGLLWVASLPFGLGVLFARRRRLWPLGVVVASYAAAAVLFHPTVRAFGPLLLAGAWLNGQGIALLAQGRWRRRIAVVVGALLLWTNLLQVLWVLRRYEPVGVALGFESREDYLRTGLSCYPAYRWLDENAGPSAVVLVVGESRIFHLDRPAIAGSYLDQPPLSGFLPRADLQTGAAALERAGVSHILINRAQYRVAPQRPPSTDELLFFSDPATHAVLESLLEDRSRRVFQQGPVEIHQLVGEPGP